MSKNSYNDFSDDALLLLYKQSGDNALLGNLLQRYTLLLLGVGIKYLKEKSAAQDAVQQVFLKALTHLPNDEIKNFKGWLYILMRNHCLQQLRDKHYPSREYPSENISTSETDWEYTAWKELTLDNLYDTINQLDEPQQKCVILFYLKKMSYKQIGEQTGYSFEQVKSHIQNGKRNLKLLLNKKEAEK